MSAQQNICESSEYPESPMPRTSSLRDAQSITRRRSPSFDNDLRPLSSKTGMHDSRSSTRGNVPSTSNRLLSSSSESSGGSPQPKRRNSHTRRGVQSSSRRRRAPTPDYVLPAHYSAKGMHTPRSSTRRRNVPSYRVLSPLSDSSDESPQPMRRKNPKAPKSSTRTPSYSSPSCSESDGSPEPRRKNNRRAHKDRELSRDELIRLMEECEADPSFPTPSDSEEDDAESSGSEFEEPTPKKMSAPKRPRERSPVIERTEHQKSVGKKTLIAIFKETQNPSREMRAKIAKVLKMNKSLRKKNEIPDRVKRITPEMRMKLEAEFETNPNPTTERKTELATEFNVLHERVTAWFIRRRQKQDKPEEFAAAQEKRRKYKYERDCQAKVRENRQPVFRFTEYQRNFMNEKMKELDGKKVVAEQCRVWGDEINLTSYQVGHFIRNHLAKQKETEYERKMRNEKRRRLKLFLRDKSLVPGRKSRLVRQTPKRSELHSKFVEKPFVSKADAEEWAKKFNMAPSTILTLAHKNRERLLKKYLSGEKTVDSLPPAMRSLEEEYSKNVFIKTVAEAIGMKETVGVDLISVNGYFSMRRRLDRERGVDLLKEEDVPKILAKDVLKYKKSQKKVNAAVNLDEPNAEDPSGLDNDDFDEDGVMEETSRPQSPRQRDEYQDFEVSGSHDVFDDDDFDVPQNLETSEREIPDEDSSEDDYDTTVDSEKGMYDSDWEYEDLLAGENEDPDNNVDVDGPAGANMLIEPKQEDLSGADVLEPNEERM
ncbi:hypothetical protein CRE_20880 [Caenorhabditis remanei]|uniref:Homeobox domain-containing protein n=1 Tax=Caenorhabditis remanei TaxID=31234 RepID=E3MV33_CAERE|nr:hypothetical protein CRE_20880 [Caenorhabditis remanei]